jgi:hypothetical protein
MAAHQGKVAHLVAGGLAQESTVLHAALFTLIFSWQLTLQW